MEPYFGEIKAFPYNFAPRGWAPCDGRVLPIQQYCALFSLLGTTYGGNGTTNFALPDLRGRTVLGSGQGNGLPAYNNGQKGGAETVTLTAAQIPAHTHGVKVSANSTTAAPEGNFFGPVAGDAVKAYDPTPEAALNPAAVAATGGNAPHNNLPPSLGLNWCIALQGVYPSRP
jgi:microcystin-dependent protein